MPYQKHCFIIVRSLKNQELFYLYLRVNISGTTIHSVLGIKLRTKLLGLNGKFNAALRNRLSEVKLLIIDELSMASSDLWTDIDSKLEDS